MSAIPEAVEYGLGKIPVSLFMSWIVYAVLFVVSFILKKTYKIIPDKLQAFFELSFEWIFDLADEAIGAKSKRYYPLLISLFFFILISNLIGLFPGFQSPTADLSITLALSVIVFIYFNLEGIREQGINYILHFFGPSLAWYMFPVRILLFFIEVIGDFVKPISMAMRLFCNIFAKELLLSILAFLLVKFLAGPTIFEKVFAVAPLMLRPGIILLGVLVSLVQAVVFLMLTIVYLGAAVNTEKEHH